MPSHHDQLRALIEQALDLSTPVEREQLLAACVDPALAADARVLLGLQTRAAQLDQGAAQLARLDLVPAMPARIGPYRIVGPLGRGGMGAVYHGVRDDGSFHMDVAIKVVRDAYSAEQRQRFQRERELLARLEHPAIARVLDGGTTEGGQPWMAIERVDGIPLDQYVREQQLPVRRRVGLMLRVLDAVQFAHQSLIVHRDLKPSNVLVQADGHPKLLDFGVAKPLGEADHTQTAERAPMTFAYAAPEQIKGEVITTATDVYALGVMLYELLTGERPHKAKGESPLSLLQAITDTDATAPSEGLRRRLSQTTSKTGIDVRELKGDLDTIILKALSRDPTRRYPSAQSMRDDLDRYLDNRPIAARPDAFSYRARKWIRRNRLSAAIAALAAIGFLIAAILVVQERNRAIKNAQIADATKRFVLKAFTGANRWVSGEALTARDLALRGLAEVETELKDQPEARVEMYDTLGHVLGRSGPISASVRAREAQIAGMKRLGTYSQAELIEAEIELLYTYWWAEDPKKARDYKSAIERDHGAQLTFFDRLSMHHLDAQIATQIGDYASLAHALPVPVDAAMLQAAVAASRPDQENSLQTFPSYGYWYWLQATMQQRQDRKAAALAVGMAQATERHVAKDNINRGGFMMIIADYLLRLSRDAAATALADRSARWLEAQFGEDHDFALYIVSAKLYAHLQDGELEQAQSEFLRLEAVLEKQSDEMPQFGCRDHYLDGGYLALKQGEMALARHRFSSALQCARKLDDSAWQSPHARAAQAALKYLDVLERKVEATEFSALAMEQQSKDDGWWWQSAAWLADWHWQHGDFAKSKALLGEVQRWHQIRGARFDADLLKQYARASLPAPAQPVQDIAEAVRIGTLLIADGERIRAERLRSATRPAE